jgi:hypothetical protein
MLEIINMDYEIKKISTNKQSAIEIFEKYSMNEKADLLKYKEYDDVKIYKCNEYIDHFYGHMLPSTGYIKIFDIKKYQGGVVILGPSEENKELANKFIPKPKLSNIYYEAERWSELIGVDKVTTLNKIIENNEYGNIIRIVEALHEKKLSQIADIIKEKQKRVILIAAPSSSGKTSFAHRLSIHLRVNNLKPVSISLDDYFVDREKTPLDEYGNYDFESIYAIDLERFNSDLQKLLNGEEISLPRFNFKLGKREESGKKIIKKILNKEVDMVMDPTFLLDSVDWEFYEQPIDYIKEKYILCYLLTDNRKHWKAIIQFAKHENKELIIIPVGGYSYVKSRNVIKNCSVGNFLYLIKNADVVITDSFHATVFSTIYRKNFLVFERHNPNTIESQNSRIYNLLNCLGAEQCLLSYNTKKINKMFNINYSKIESKLNKEIKKSKDYLKNVLKKD